MRPDGLRERLREIEIPDERGAEERAQVLARRGVSEYQVAERSSTGRRLLVAVTAAINLGLVLLSPAGAAIRNLVSDVVTPGQNQARPALASLPAPGKLLVQSRRGTWVVQADGAQRLLGDYEEATWSPHGIYVAATRGPQLTALEADGGPRWTITGADPASMPSWQAPDGFRIAYLSGSALRVVNGDGTGDRQVTRSVADIAPVWRPGTRHVIAFVDGVGVTRVVDTETGRRLKTPSFAAVHDLAWSLDGTRLAVAFGAHIAVVRASATPNAQATSTRGVAKSIVEQVAFSPSGDRLAFTRSSTGNPEAGSELILGRLGPNRIRERTLFSGPGHLTDPTWSPDGRWLL